MGVPLGSQADHQLPLLGVVPSFTNHLALRLRQTHSTACGFVFFVFLAEAWPAVVCVYVQYVFVCRGEQWAALCKPLWQDIYLRGEANKL